MDIRVSRCNKTVKCRYCQEDISIGEAVVFGKLYKLWRNGKLEQLRWPRSYRWHAKRVRDGQCCWIAEALEHFGQNQYVERRGRRKLLLPLEDRRRRLCLLKERARQVQKLKTLMLTSLDNIDLERVMQIGRRLEELKQEIEPLGGIPKKWL